MSLFHDDIKKSVSLLEPTTAFSIFAWIFVILGAFKFRKSVPLFFFGTLWFLTSHSIESSILSLELVHEHRNYFPMIEILLAVSGLLIKACEITHMNLKANIILPIIFLILLSATALRAQHWKDMPSLVASEALKNPSSNRTQHNAGRWYYLSLQFEESPSARSENYIRAKEAFEQTYLNLDIDLSGLFALLRLNESVGAPPEDAWVEELLFRIKTVQIERENMKRIQEFFICNINQACKTKTALINKIVLAFEDNPTVLPYFKAHIYSQIAHYIESQGTPEIALHYLKKAINTEPNNYSHQLEMAIMLFQSNKLNKSKELLQQLNVEKLNANQKKIYQMLIEKTEYSLLNI